MSSKGTLIYSLGIELVSALVTRCAFTSNYIRLLPCIHSMTDSITLTETLFQFRFREPFTTVIGEDIDV